MRVRVSSPALRKLDGLIFGGRIGRRYQLYFSRRRSQVGKARVCKTPITGSSPVVASRITKHPRKRGVFLVGSWVLHAVCFAIPSSPQELPNTPETRGVFRWITGSACCVLRVTLCASRSRRRLKNYQTPPETRGVFRWITGSARCGLRSTLCASQSRRRLKNYQTPPETRGVFRRIMGSARCGFAERCGLSGSDIIAALCI